MQSGTEAAGNASASGKRLKRQGELAKTFEVVVLVLVVRRRSHGDSKFLYPASTPSRTSKFNFLNFEELQVEVQLSI